MPLELNQSWVSNYSTELTDADEVHVQQDVLVEPQDPQSCPEQELLPIPKDNVPDSARHVQREGLCVERQDPGGG